MKQADMNSYSNNMIWRPRADCFALPALSDADRAAIAENKWRTEEQFRKNKKFNVIAGLGLTSLAGVIIVMKRGAPADSMWDVIKGVAPFVLSSLVMYVWVNVLNTTPEKEDDTEFRRKIYGKYYAVNRAAIGQRQLTAGK